MRSDKWTRAMATYQGHHGQVTVDHVRRNVDAAYPCANSQLTGAQYGYVMSVAHASYHAGRASAGAELIDGEVIYADGIMLPIAIARRLDVTTETVITWERADNGAGMLSRRGGDNDYYHANVDGNYVRIDRSVAEDMSRAGQIIYWRNRDYVTVVSYNGVEIDRISGII